MSMPCRLKSTDHSRFESSRSLCIVPPLSGMSVATCRVSVKAVQILRGLDIWDKLNGTPSPRIPVPGLLWSEKQQTSLSSTSRRHMCYPTECFETVIVTRNWAERNPPRVAVYLRNTYHGSQVPQEESFRCHLPIVLWCHRVTELSIFYMPQVSS